MHIEPISTAKLAAHGTVAVFGAVAHALNAHRNGKSKTISDFFALAIMSSFSGVIFGLIGLHFFAEEIYLSMVLAGTGGYLGVEGMAAIAPFVIGKIRTLFNIK